MSDATTLDLRPVVGTASAPAAATRLFRTVCVLVPLIAALALHLQLPGAAGAHLGMIQHYITSVFGVVTLLWLIYLVAVKFCVPRLRRLSWRRFLPRWHTRYFRTLPWVDMGFALGSLAVTLATFQLYKSTVVSAGGFHYDALFAQMDRWLFLGADPWTVTHAILPSASASFLVDFVYHPLFLPMIAPFVFSVVIRGNQALRYTYMATYLVSWLLIGMFLAQALASAGPIYNGALWGDGMQFAALQERLAAQSEAAGPFYAMTANDYLLRAHLAGETGLGTGISAMPSMHVALAAMCALAGAALSRRLAWAMVAYTIFIWIGSIHLGWHYAVDGLLSGALTVLVWWGCARAFGLRMIAAR